MILMLDIKKSRLFAYSFLVQKMGLEPTRTHIHRLLRPERLPIPPLLQIYPSVLQRPNIISFLCFNVNKISQKSDITESFDFYANFLAGASRICNHRLPLTRELSNALRLTEGEITII